jgi:alkaline phosphatase
MKIWRQAFVFTLFLGLLLCSSHVGLAQYAETGKVELDHSFYTPAAEEETYSLVKRSKAKNVILLIGDGMAIPQVDVARFTAAGPDGYLYFEKMPVTGWMRTHSLNYLTTDSAAAGTAMASGFKTNSGMISMLPNGQKIKTLLEGMKDLGKATGMAVTSTMTHATPGSFGAHVEARKQEDLIAEDYLANRIDVLFGGGKKFFVPQSVEGSGRSDDKDLIKEAVLAGYSVIETREELLASEADRVLGLFQMDALKTVAPEPSLAELTEKAISILSRDSDGFFLMVEGSQIDWAGHGNDLEYNIRQTLLFDQAVQKSLEFAKEDSRTLVIVTSDHECGGLVFKTGSLDGENLEVAWTSKGHTPTSVPVYAYGPGAQQFSGVYDNTDLAKKIADVAGIRDFPALKETKGEKTVQVK